MGGEEADNEIVPDVGNSMEVPKLQDEHPPAAQIPGSNWFIFCLETTQVIFEFCPRVRDTVY